MKSLIVLVLLLFSISSFCQEEIFSMSKEELKQYIKENPQHKDAVRSLFKNAFERAIKPMNVRLQGGALVVDSTWLLRLSSLRPRDAFEINYEAFEWGCPQQVQDTLGNQEIIIPITTREN